MEGQGVKQHDKAMGQDVEFSTSRRRREEMEEGQGVEQHHEAMGRDVEFSTQQRRKEEMKEAQGVEQHHEAMGQDIEFSTSRRRTEEMKEGQGVEQYHEAMGRDVEFSTQHRRKEEMEEEQGVEQCHEVMVLDPEFSTPCQRKEEMEEEQGVEQHQEALFGDVELNPELWDNLPSDLIDLVVDKVLIGLPFSKVFRFCCVCNRWKDFLLSMEYLLYFHNLDNCMIFNPRTGVWDSVPLLLSPADALRLQNMELKSCDGGLLYFVSALRDELIVFNPLTRRCSATQSGPNAARKIWSLGRTTTKSFPSEWRLGWHASLWDVRDPPVSTEDITVKTIAASDAGYFQLLLHKQYRYGTPTVSLNLKDSRRGRWVTVPDVYSDFHFVIFPTCIWKASARESLMLGFYTKPGGTFNLLFYDIVAGRCHWFWNSSSLHYGSKPMQRKPLFATVSHGGEFEFLEFLDGGLTLVRAPFPPPTECLRQNLRCKVLPDFTTIREFSEIFSFVYVEQGDSLYSICLFRQGRGQVHISVRTNNLVNGLERISKWMECRPSAWTRRDLPRASNFHILRPSFLSPG